MALKSSTAGHLMTHLSMRKSPNCLTAYINLPMETLELRWGTVQMSSVFPFAPFLSNLSHKEPLFFKSAVIQGHGCFSPLIHLQNNKSVSRFGFILFFCPGYPDCIMLTGAVFGWGQSVYCRADNRDAAQQTERDVRECPEEAGGGLCHLSKC